MKIITDCNVIIAAGLTNGVSRQVLKIILYKYQNFVSDDIVKEYRNVIIRPKFSKYFSTLLGIIENTCICSKWVDYTPSVSRYELYDEKDKIYLNLALSVNADYLVTGNGKDFPQKQYDNVIVISPREFLTKYND